MDAAVSQTGLDFRDLVSGAFGGDGFVQLSDSLRFFVFVPEMPSSAKIS